MTRDKEYALWVACAAFAVLFAMAGPISWWQGTLLWACVVSGRAAARRNERRKAADQVHHHYAAALRSAAQGMEDAALQHGSHGIHTTLTYAQAAYTLRQVADQRDKDQPADAPRS